jgi:GT2 family glycosyltransferase
MSLATSPELSVIIVNYNTKQHLVRCLESLRDFPTKATHEVIVIDNASVDGSADAVAKVFPECLLIRANSNEGYGVALNYAAQKAEGQWLIFLNPDVEVTEGAVDVLLDFAKRHPAAGVVGPRLVDSDGRFQPSARRFASPGLLLLESFRLHRLLPRTIRGRLLLETYFAHDVTLRVPWVSGACHLIPRTVWRSVGPLTEDTFCGSDDYDFCYRTRKRGYDVWICVEASMIHHGSVSVRQRWPVRLVEELAMHNTYVVLSRHWPQWRVRLYAFSECLCWLLELVRTRLVPRAESNSSEYCDRVRNRLRLAYSLFSGRQTPIRRFEPTSHGHAEQSRPVSQRDS